MPPPAGGTSHETPRHLRRRQHYYYRTDPVLGISQYTCADSDRLTQFHSPRETIPQANGAVRTVREASNWSELTFYSDSSE